MNTITFKERTDDLIELNTLQATFIAGSRTMSAKRTLEIAKKYIVKGNVIWGSLQNAYIEGFEAQPHFVSLDEKKLKAVLEQFEKLNLPNKFTILKYDQSELAEVLEKLETKKAVFINGSWKIAFHRKSEYEILERKGIEVKLISPFVDKEEAVKFANSIAPEVEAITDFDKAKKYSDSECMRLAHLASKRSFDYTWQTGSVLVKDGIAILAGHNRILPFETYMWHSGSLKEHGIGKEKELSQMHNLNNNDTLHAEMDVLIQALNNQLDLTDATLYVSLMPCPNCARAIAASKISKVVYEQEHFGGIAEEILSGAGKIISRMERIV